MPNSRCKSQAELIAVKEARNLDLSLKITQANAKMSDLNVKFIELKDKYNSLQTDHISQSNYVLELQSTITKGVEESSQLLRDLK